MNESNYIPIAALNQYAYCPHRCWRMFCAGEFSENQYTLEGTGLHDRVHTFRSNLRDDTWQVRAIWLKSDRHGLIGKSDLIEDTDGNLYPVEYKRCHRCELENDALQVCAQALCLEDMTGQILTHGFVYYAQSHQRQPVDLTPELREMAIATIDAVQELFHTGHMPKPEYTKRCKGCSLYTHCLPRAAKKISKYRESN